MSHRRIKVKGSRGGKPDEFNEVFRHIRQLGDPVTPMLNRALTRLLGDQRFSGTERVHLWTIRFSFGNWSNIAIRRFGMESTVETPDEELQAFDEQCLERLLLADAPCPWCGKPAGKQPCLPNKFRWHRHCMILAYAADAATSPHAADRKWAADITSELMQALGSLPCIDTVN